MTKARIILIHFAAAAGIILGGVWSYEMWSRWGKVQVVICLIGLVGNFWAMFARIEDADEERYWTNEVRRRQHEEKNRSDA